MVRTQVIYKIMVGSLTSRVAGCLGRRVNLNVFKILPLTTLRTIDLGGKKIFDPLFSRFCAEMRVFFEVNNAPECVQECKFSVPTRLPQPLLVNEDRTVMPITAIVGKKDHTRHTFKEKLNHDAETRMDATGPGPRHNFAVWRTANGERQGFGNADRNRLSSERRGTDGLFPRQHRGEALGALSQHRRLACRTHRPYSYSNRHGGPQIENPRGKKPTQRKERNRCKATRRLAGVWPEDGQHDLQQIKFDPLRQSRSWASRSEQRPAPCEKTARNGAPKTQFSVAKVGARRE